MRDSRDECSDPLPTAGPFHAADRLPHDREQPVYLVEGRENCEALERSGRAAVGIETDPSTTPSRKALKILTGRPVVLWPNAGDAGRERMEEIRERLEKVAASLDQVDVELLGLGDGEGAAHLHPFPNEVPLLGLQETRRRAIATRLSDVEPEAVEFLWEPYLPLGKLTLLEGDPGDGKTFVALAVTAALSSGSRLPGDGPPRAPATTLYLTAEDGVADTLRPRLDSLGADCSNVVALSGWREGNAEGPLTLAELPLIEEQIAEHQPALVVLDPIQAYLGATVDMHRANQVRPLLAELGKLAERHRCAVLAVRHLRKSSADRAIQRGLGSIDFAAAARSILLVAPDPEDETGARRIVAHVKSSPTAHGESLAFRLAPELGFSWDGTSELSADELLVPRSPKRRSKVDEAEDFLLDALSDGPRAVADLKAEAPCSWRSVETAKKRLQIATTRSGFGRDGAWSWRLPKGPEAASEAADPSKTAKNPGLRSMETKALQTTETKGPAIDRKAVRHDTTLRPMDTGAATGEQSPSLPLPGEGSVRV